MAAARSTQPKSLRRRAKAARQAPVAFLVTLSLLLQLLFIPYHQALAAPAAGLSDARIAADLKATFGDAASLCVRLDDRGAPAKAPAGGCGDDCPFCRFAAEAATLLAPHFPALPVRYEAATLSVYLPTESEAPPAAPLRRQRARAPPLAA